jgi:DNA modification methylase
MLPTLPAGSVRCCVTSPPYFGLRDYGCEGQIGLEKTPEAYVAEIVGVFREVRRVLADDGTLWLNLGDSYAQTNVVNRAGGDGTRTDHRGIPFGATKKALVATGARQTIAPGLKQKDLVGIPWRVAFALQADGWYLRSDIIWCLSGGTWLYAKTDASGPTLTTIKDLARLKTGTVKLWNGARWTRLLGISRTHRKGDEVEIVLRSGERISCTPTHRFPTERGILPASELRPGDVVERCRLPEPDHPRDCALDEDAAWFAGLYIAEGSRAGDTIQLAGHAKERERWERIQKVAAKYGGTATRTVIGNKMDIRLYGKVLAALLDELVGGRTAKDKGFSPVVWRYSNHFLVAMLDGYLSGDGHWDAKNHRWRLGFTRNYNLERDIRTACARLGYTLTLKPSTVLYDGRRVPAFRGEIRTERSGHHNERDMGEVVAVRRARCREVYDIGVDAPSHLFALASGVLTHNSKPNPMPESVTDRPTKAHEYVFLLSKSARYFYDAERIAEPSEWDGKSGTKNYRPFAEGGRIDGGMNSGGPAEWRNARTVWTIPTQPTPDAHFATFPEALAERCILAGSAQGDTVLDPFFGSGTVGKVAERLGRAWIGCELNPAYVEIGKKKTAQRGMFA